MSYTKHFNSLESNPETSTALIHHIGISQSVKFIDVCSVDAIDLHHALGFILVLPACTAAAAATTANDKQKARELKTAAIKKGEKEEEEEEVMWLKKTIKNASGLYAVLHCVCNVPGIVEPQTPIDHLIKSPNRTAYLERSEDIEKAYTAAATARIEHKYCYICLVPTQSGRPFVLDAEMDGPIEKATTPPKGAQGDSENESESVIDRLSQRAFDVLTEYMHTSEVGGGGYRLMALVRS